MHWERTSLPPLKAKRAVIGHQSNHFLLFYFLSLYDLREKMVPNEVWLAGKVNVIEHGSTNLVLLLLKNLEKRLTQPYSHSHALQ